MFQLSFDSSQVKQGWIFRSSHHRYSVKKGVLNNFAKFTRKHQCQSLFFTNVAELRPGTLLK